MEDVRTERDILHTEDLAASGAQGNRDRLDRPDRPDRPDRLDRPDRSPTYEEPPLGSAHTALFSPEETESFRSEWKATQIGFVDEPRQSVERADALVARLMKRLAEVFAGERSELERQWDRGDQISTEDLRIALTRYRSFFDRLLSF